ncbi:MAG: 4-(cytidine 5'-diphospho)-2-C-methyl-D-erythritol kinase [Bacteroidota bacterium]
MILYPNAKINIGLNIVEKRSDGFHNIESIFVPIGLSDILEIVETKSENKVSFSSSGIYIPGDSASNLCVKAYYLLREKYDLPCVKFHLHKQIPIGAGLGGGSSDAAFTLIGINKLFHLNISNLDLKKYASQLGSDCAFFIENKPTYNFNKGDDYQLIDLNLKDYYFVLAFPPIHVGTADAYSGVKPEKPIENLQVLINKDILEWKNAIKNDFEKSIFKKYPDISKIKDCFYQAGATYSSMSGSGSSVFAIFEKKIDTKLLNLPVVWEGYL